MDRLQARARDEGETPDAGAGVRRGEDRVELKLGVREEVFNELLRVGVDGANDWDLREDAVYPGDDSSPRRLIPLLHQAVLLHLPKLIKKIKKYGLLLK